MAIEDKNATHKKKSYRRRVKRKRKTILWLEKRIFPVVTVSVLLISAILLASGWHFVNQFEEGVIEVCADQQDTYVQLVLDQINLKENRKDQEIIQDILNSIDSSTNKYWTFSKNETMLFVKDVLETNKYKGFTASTYYETGNGKKFFDSLRLNVVTHGNIKINSKTYVASGVVFEYNDATYKLCLLTNKDIFLDNNSFMRTKINVGLFFCIAIIMLILSSMLLARHNSMLDKKLLEKDDMILSLNSSVGKLNDRLQVKDTYDTRKTLFPEEMLDEFLERIEHKGVSPVTIAFVKCKDTNEFLNMSQVLLDRGVLRFKMNYDDTVPKQNVYVENEVVSPENTLILIFLNCDLINSNRNINYVCNERNTLLRIKEWNKKGSTLLDFYKNLKGEIIDG